MSLLAEPRKKQKISIDPRNLQWKDDDNVSSYFLLRIVLFSEGFKENDGKNGMVRWQRTRKK